MKRNSVAIAIMIIALLAGCSQTETREEVDPAKAAEIYVGLGVTYMEERKYEFALENFKKALRIDPKLPAAHNGIAILYEQLGEYELAATHYRKAIDLNPKDGKALNNYGTFLCRTGKYRESEEYFERAAAVTLYSEPASALKNAGLCALKDNDSDKAEYYFRKSLEVNPTYAPSLLQMGKLMLSNGEYLKTRAYVQRYHQVTTPSAESLWLAIQAERALGDSNAEASYALMLRSRFPDSPQAAQMGRLDNGERSTIQ